VVGTAIARQIEYATLHNALVTCDVLCQCAELVPTAVFCNGRCTSLDTQLAFFPPHSSARNDAGCRRSGADLVDEMMRFRKLRIAWSVFCGIACVLLGTSPIERFNLT
jgi:hypothetical protein